MGKDYSDIAFKDDGRLKLLIIVGTRPEVIRLSEVIKKCRRHFDCLLAHTGQNYDYTLNGIFFRDLSLDDPNVYLDAVGEDLGVGDLSQYNDWDEVFIASLENNVDGITVSDFDGDTAGFTETIDQGGYRVRTRMSDDGTGFKATFEHFGIKHLPDMRRLEWLEKNSAE